MEEYNLLTQKLLSEGYTVEDYPDYVRLPKSQWGKNPLQNLNGGFEYTPQYRANMVFKTGCGLMLKGSELEFGSTFYMGILWIPENDNPVINCPYRKDSCNFYNPVLNRARGGCLSKLVQCDCHHTDEPYDYEKSVDKARSDELEKKRRQYEAFVKSRNGHVCQWHAYYNEWDKKWTHNYDPTVCAQFCRNVGKNCDLTHMPVSKKRGNVFYDVKVSYIRNDGTLFDGQEIVEINKGVRFFETAKSITICEAVAQKCKDEIERRERSRHHKEIFLHGWKVDVMNIRAEQRESRDLIQDLQDIKNGIKISHASDLKKISDENKKERRQKSKQNKIEKLEKKLLDIGYHNLPKNSLDRIHADKWIGEERISELEEIRKQKMKDEQGKPVQLSLFDMNDFK